MNLEGMLSHLSFLSGVESNVKQIINSIGITSNKLEKTYRYFLAASDEFRVASLELESLAFLEPSIADTFRNCYTCPRVS